MIDRKQWKKAIEACWEKAPICWLTGVRRSGKTTLAKIFAGARFLNCDLTQTADLLEHPESFFKSIREPLVIFDEIHQLKDPSRVLKIGADEFPHLKILATGSSSLAATQKFRDSLTGRKRSVVLLPVLYTELEAFGCLDIRQRLFRGGLPQALLAAEDDPGFYGEWLDSYFARDVQELFHVEKRAGFLKLLEMVLRQSGGRMEATSLARACGLSRPTVLNYLEVFQITHVVHVLRPFHGGGRQEILHQPKVYGFDTGFVRYTRGWTELREKDCGGLWEHLALDALLATPALQILHFWQDKQRREIDFVIPGDHGRVDAVECKWDAAAFEAHNLLAFRSLHPHGRNIVVSPHVSEPYTRALSSLEITFTPLDQLAHLLFPA